MKRHHALSRLRQAGSSVLAAKRLESMVEESPAQPAQPARLVKLDSLHNVLQNVRMDSTVSAAAATPTLLTRQSSDASILSSGHADGTELERVAMRLDGFEMYSFLASLISGFSYGCLNDSDTRPVLREKLPNALAETVAVAYSFSMMLSIFTGLYATCVFAFCSLYSKTALAELKDDR